MNHQTEIGGRTFAFGKMPATDALRVEVAVARVIGEPLFKALVGAVETGATDKDDVMNAIMQSAGATMGLLTSKMDAQELIETMETIFKFASCDGKAITSIDGTFTGRNMELWQAFIFGLRFNFHDFFTGDLFAFLPGAKKRSS